MDPSQVFQLSALTNDLGGYQSVLGAGSITTVNVNQLNPLSLNVTAHAIGEFPIPQSPPPPLAATHVALIRSGVRLAQSSLSMGTPQWFTNAVDGKATYLLIYPFNVAVGMPYSPSALREGAYEVALVGGTNAYPLFAFNLAPDASLPPLTVEPATNSVRLAWKEPEAQGFVALEESSDLQKWERMGVYLRFEGSVNAPAASGSRFYRLTVGR